MPNAARLKDEMQNHCGIIVQASNNVFINGLGVARVDDFAFENPCQCSTAKNAGTCDETIVSGSSSVFINGKPAARVGDMGEYGGIISSGSSNVFIGG